MKICFAYLLSPLLLSLLLVACDTVDAPEVGSDPDAAREEARLGTTPVAECVDLLNPTSPLYRVCFEGASYDAQRDETTFRYTAYATGTGISSSDNFFLEIPKGLANPVAMTPKNPVTLVEKTVAGGVVYGAEWGNSVSRKGRAYAYTFAGQIGEGQITTVIEGSGYAASATVKGPAVAGTDAFKIQGTVFNDTDGSESTAVGYGVFDPTYEFGLDGVTLALLHADGSPVLDALGNPRTVTTGANGAYLFDGLTAGTYRVTVPTSNALYETYNDQPIYVFTSGSPIDGAAQRSATVGPEATLDFGFWVDGSHFAQALQDPSSDYAVRLTGDNYFWAPILNGLSTYDPTTGWPAYIVTLNGYVVTFLGTTITGSGPGGETTYRYRVLDLGARPDVSHFTLEYDAEDDGVTCAAPIRTFPAGAEVGPDPTTGITRGVKWNTKIPAGGYKDFSVTFAGVDLWPGAVQGALKNGTKVDLDLLPGACARGVASRNDLRHALSQVILPATGTGTGTTTSYLFLSAFNALFQLQGGETLEEGVNRLVTPLPDPLTSPFTYGTFVSLTISKQVKFLLGLSTSAGTLADRSFLDIEAFLSAQFAGSKKYSSGSAGKTMGGNGGTTDRERTLSAF